MRRPRISRYTLIKGQYSIHNPSDPRRGPQPDGDTVNFFPDSLDFVRALKRFSGRAPDISNGHINVRYEGIDALETHFQGTHQDLGGFAECRSIGRPESAPGLRDCEWH